MKGGDALICSACGSPDSAPPASHRRGSARWSILSPVAAASRGLPSRRRRWSGVPPAEIGRAEPLRDDEQPGPPRRFAPWRDRPVAAAFERLNTSRSAIDPRAEGSRRRQRPCRSRRRSPASPAPAGWPAPIALWPSVPGVRSAGISATPAICCSRPRPAPTIQAASLATSVAVDSALLRAVVSVALKPCQHRKRENRENQHQQHGGADDHGIGRAQAPAKAHGRTRQHRWRGRIDQNASPSARSGK